MRLQRFILLLFFCYVELFVTTTESNPPPVYLNATIDNTLSIDVYVSKVANSHVSSSVTGFKIYFTKDASLSSDRFKEWQEIELLSSANSYNIKLDGQDLNIKPDTIYRIRATVLINHVESLPSKIVYINTKDAAPKPPVIQSTKVLINSSVIIQFVPGEDTDVVTNYTLEYRELLDPSMPWTTLHFQSGAANRVLLAGLRPNTTYAVRMFVSEETVLGQISKEAVFSTNNTVQLPVVSVWPSTEMCFDPDILNSLEIHCTAISNPPAEIHWLVNDQSVSIDHSFYTLTSSVIGDKTISIVKGKSRTRTDNLTCIASNPAGDVAISVQVTIRGPGSPPSSITLSSERGGYTVKWQPPSHSNGNITKYVVYHSFNKDDPLSDWHKLDLDGSESSVRVLSEAEEGFYVRVQAATESGPGLISDIIAIERDTVPITVSLYYSHPLNREPLLLEPAEKVSVRCTAWGKPRPSLYYTLAEHEDSTAVEDDVWQTLASSVDGDRVVADVQFSTITSKTLHCKAKNTAGSNSSSLEFTVKKPGDSPRNLQVLSIDARDVILVWDSPKYPNLPIKSYEILLSEELDDDEENWQKYETSTREKTAAVTRLSLPTDQLKPSREYFVRVRALNAAGAGALTDAIPFVTPNGGPESAPTDVRVEINEANTAVLSWKRPNSTTETLYYVIYFTRDLSISNEDYKDWQSFEVPATVIRHKFDYQVGQIGLKPKTFYRVRISAKNDIAEGPVSETREFETAYSELPIPTDIKTKRADDNTVYIYFIAVRDPDDHSKAVENYKMEIAQTEDVLNAHWTMVEPKTTAVDDVSSQVELVIDGTHLQPNKMYWVKVTALLENPTRLVQASKPRWFRTGDGKHKTKAIIEEGPIIISEPNLFEKLVITCRAEGSPAPQITWIWNDATIETEWEEWTINEEIFERSRVSHLTRSTTHESGNVTCLATNVVGNATTSSEIKILGPGSPPTQVVAKAWRNQINVSWLEPEIPNGIIKKYIVYYSVQDVDDLSDWEKLETSNTSIIIAANSAQLRYLIRVQAVTAAGPGIISDSMECTSDLFYEPLSVSLTATNIVNFEAEPNQNVVLRCVAKGQPLPLLFYSWEGENETEFSNIEVGPLKSGIASGELVITTASNRTVQCRAKNKYETKQVNRMIIVRKPGDAPANISWRFEEDNSLYINWDRVKYPNGNVSYVLYLSNFVDKVSGPPVRIPQVPFNVNVSLRISAENEWGEGEKTMPLLIPTPHGGPINAPILTTLHSEEERVKIEWSPPTKPNGRIKNYTVYYKTENADESNWQSITLSENHTVHFFNKTELQTDTKYKVKISATNHRHEGPTTQIYWFDTYSTRLQDLSAPTNVSAHLGNTSLIVHLPVGHAYKNYMMYVRPEYSNHYWKYEAMNVTGTQQRIIVEHFPLDRNVSYRMKISGIINGKESKHSEEFDLESFDQADIQFPPIEDQSPTEITEESTEKRRIVKEPPL